MSILCKTTLPIYDVIILWQALRIDKPLRWSDHREMMDAVLDRIAGLIAAADPIAMSGDRVTPILRPALIDNFGCILAGSTTPVVEKILSATASFSQGHGVIYRPHNAQSPLMRPPPYAAMINAAAGHAWDFDDWEDPGNTHPTVVIFPALLAASDHAKAQGLKISGHHMMTAYAIGLEVIMRLGKTVTLSHYQRGFHATVTLGALGAAAASARLLGLSQTESAYTLGIAASQATGYTMQFGTDTKPLQAGFAARAGLEAALFAQSGMTSSPQVITDQRGFAGLMGDINEERLRDLTHRLGEEWMLAEYGLVLKPWPSCGYTHRMMTAAQSLHADLRDRIQDIETITLTIVDFHFEILPYHHPDTLMQALFSLPACTAQMLCHGQLTLADGHDAFWERAMVQRLIERTKVIAKPARDPSQNYCAEQPDIITVTLKDKTKITASAVYPIGAPQNPMGQDAIAEKFMALTGHNREGFDRLMTWPEQDDVADFFRSGLQ